MSKEKHVAEWMLERYLLGELPRKERRQLEKELERDDGLRAELEELRAFRPADPRHISGRAGDPRDPEKSGAGPAAAGGGPPLAPGLAGGAGIGARPVPAGHPAAAHPPSPGPAPGDYIASKGGAPLPGPVLQLYQKSGDNERILRDGDTAQAGDRLQLAYIPGEQTHGVILSIDGAGSITLHFPEKADGSTALRRGRRIFLGYSFELDRAPVFERFFFVSARQALPTAAILAAAEKLAADPGRAMSGTLELPAGCGQSSLLIRK